MVRKVSDHNYLISTPEHKRQTQLCHANLLKSFYNPSVLTEVIRVAVAAAAVSSPVKVFPEDVATPDDCLFQPCFKKF